MKVIWKYNDGFSERITLETEYYGEVKTTKEDLKAALQVVKGYMDEIEDCSECSLNKICFEQFDNCTTFWDLSSLDENKELELAKERLEEVEEEFKRMSKMQLDKYQEIVKAKKVVDELEGKQ